MAFISFVALALAATQTLALAQTSALALLRLSDFSYGSVLVFDSRAKSETCGYQGLWLLQRPLRRLFNMISGSILALARALSFHMHFCLPPGVQRIINKRHFFPVLDLPQWESNSNSSPLQKNKKQKLCYSAMQIARTQKSLSYFHLLNLFPNIQLEYFNQTGIPSKADKTMTCYSVFWINYNIAVNIVFNNPLSTVFKQTL